MKFRLLLLVFVLGSVNSIWAQDEVDVTKLMANTKNFIFSNDKNTVKGYIYTQLEAQTACCGQDRIYLEVKIDPSGYVLQVKPLTGSKQCYMQSAADIIKNIRWDASDFKGPKSVYFEIKPNIDCENRNDGYTQVRIFNNEMLDPQGNRIYDANPRPSASDVAANGGASTPATSPATQPATTPPPVAEATPASKPVVEEPKTLPQTQPIAVEESPEPQMPPAQSQPVTRSEEENTAASLPMTTTANPNAMAEADRERQRAKQRANQSSIAQEDEIKFLKEQLGSMRQREEELREQRLADERATRQRDREAAEIASARASEEVYTASAGDEDYVGVQGEGGLFFPDENSATPPASDESFAEPSATDPPKQDPNATEEQRLSERIADFERRLREMEQKSLDRERRIEQEQVELERDNDQRLALIEEMMLAEEDLEQVRENNELDQLGRERTDIEDQTLKTQDESQRLQDEMARLQTELEDKMAEISDKQAEIARLQELTIRREQEIQLARALRETEREARMMEERMRIAGVQSSGVNITNTAQGGSTSGLTLPDDFFSNEDSTRLQYLLEVIEQMRGEMQFLRGRIQELEGGAPASNGNLQQPATNVRSTGTSTRGVTVPGKLSNPNANIPEGYNRADVDESWKGIDNGIDLPVSQAPQQLPVTSGGQQPAGNKSPDASHRDTHANVSGPQFVTRTYAQGESAVKDMLKTEMVANGVCGLAQSAFSVTLDPSGKVIGYRILAANQVKVETVLMSVIPNLKFTPADYPYNQVVYLDFKADVNCAGQINNTNLKEVDPLIKN
ncbi:MAG: hypothetical protein AB8H47_07350 [Bacteroidia bacterium]